MDISVASNFERLLYDFYLDCNSDYAPSYIQNFQEKAYKLISLFGIKHLIYL